MSQTLAARCDGEFSEYRYSRMCIYSRNEPLTSTAGTVCKGGIARFVVVMISWWATAFSCELAGWRPLRIAARIVQVLARVQVQH